MSHELWVYDLNDCFFHSNQWLLKSSLFYLAQSDVNIADLFPEVRPIFLIDI